MFVHMLLILLIILILSSLLLFIVNKTACSKGKTKIISSFKILNVLEFKLKTEHIEKDTNK